VVHYYKCKDIRDAHLFSAKAVVHVVHKRFEQHEKDCPNHRTGFELYISNTAANKVNNWQEDLGTKISFFQNVNTGRNNNIMFKP
jgi:hypothetical protein